MSDLIERYVSRVAIIEQGGGNAVLIIDTVTNYAVEVICNGYDKLTQSHIELGSQITKALNMAWQTHATEITAARAKLDVAREAQVEAVAELQLAAFLAGRGSTRKEAAPTMDDWRRMARAALATIEGQSDAHRN